MPFNESKSAAGPARGVLLCINDTVRVLDVLAFVLEECGYSVLLTPSPRHGLRLFQSEQIDVVILDHEMPEMTGYEVALEMRRLKPTVPIIMNPGSAELPAEVLPLVDAIVLKDASYRALVAEVDQQMAASRTGKAHLAG